MNAHTTTVGTHETGHGRHSIASAAAFIGGAMFLLGTILHPARDGQGIAAVGQLYGLTHSVQAVGLLLLAVALASMLSSARRIPGRSLIAWYAAFVGTLTWFGLIVYDGSHNPVTARYAPDLVHTAADLDAGGGLSCCRRCCSSRSGTRSSVSHSPGAA